MATLTSLLVTLAIFGAQPHPDLSGTWMVVGDRSVTKDQNGRFVNARTLGEMFVVKQAGDDLRIVLENGNGVEWRHRLDGVETVSETPGPTGRTFRTASRATWEGSRLTITTWLADNPDTTRTALVLTLLSNGTLRVEAGPEGTPMMTAIYGRVYP